jgi:hypothetical protein
LLLNIEKANSMIQIASIAVFYVAAILLIPRLEIAYLGYGYYWKTLGKAISLFLIKFGISDKLLFRFLGIGDIINTNIKYK